MEILQMSIRRIRDISHSDIIQSNEWMNEWTTARLDNKGYSKKHIHNDNIKSPKNIYGIK